MTETLSRIRRGGGSGRPSEEGRLYRWAVWTALNPVKVILVWLLLLAGALVSANYFTAHLTGNTNSVIGSDSEKANQLIADEFPETPSETDFVVLHSTTLTAQDPAFRQVVGAAVARYRQAPEVIEAIDPYGVPDRLVAPDGRTVLVPVTLDGDDKKLQEQAAPLSGIAGTLGTDQVQVWFTGASPLAAAAVEQGNEDLSMAETIGFPAAGIVLLLAFGSLVAAAIPLALGVVAVLSAFGALGIATHFTSFDVFVQTAVSMVGIALGIDYTLFIVTRFREELARAADNGRQERARAVGRTLATAGQAVLFSGVTVVVSLSGLWLVRSAKVYSMAVGMSAAVLVMMLVAVTLLPALLGLLGGRINRLALPWARRSLAHPDPEHSAWARAIAVVMRRPVLIAVFGAILLGALSIPVFHLRYGVDLGAGAVAESPAGRGYTVVSEAYAPGVLTPVTVVVSAGGGRLTDPQLDAVARFSEQAVGNREVADVVSITRVLDAQAGGHTAAHLEAANRTAGAALAGLVSRDGDTTVITIRPRHGADTDEAADLVRELRTRADGAFAGTGLTAHVGGGPAEIVDITDESSRAMPLVIGAVLAASWLLLLIAFRSLVLPFEAIFMNLLTSGAAFGVAVLIFQEGHAAGLLGVDRTGFIQVILPLFAFALVFGLSMDYQVFMLSRMREEWDCTGDNAAAVQLGLTRTAKVITAAATIMVVVFASFMFTQILEIKQMGFMLALAVLIDATIVRLLLVPSLMRLIGHRNWWLPGWLDRTLPRAGQH
ncbi:MULTISPECIES: MMPL family transporter [Micromonospora]|uniref:MMPL family transporter n=1 Tax=Micromonospora solifontis TaxID=2487138 RepID=A0ABX9WML8_9ACTN|nr:MULTISPECIES: MMPL family transporter [Micromonospora]NES13768.1 MMPL family transporter [Micromonospora sp. PPF5-17B]NES35559.1 MMPL family transporter [Micromonospora solifontis]NES55955.1 MMPL family transporter [Micromonospora sp. PPF5-6]RNM00613.1 MMPL family transporter [Micromonospora solifontis]